MPKKIVNLNTARKAKTMQNKKATADANAVMFGKSKQSKMNEGKAAAQAISKLDGHKRED